MSNPNNYTVGWICAIATEYVAARAFLEEEHEGPEQVSTNDNNDYTLGRIGKHNVVIAALPHGEYGISSAAGVARDMLHSFPNVRIGMMVGIGGGAPSPKHDIRLGDIVVSVSGNGKGGVFQYDFGKATQDQEFQETGFLNQPPPILRAAVNGLMARYEGEGHQLEEAISGIFEKKPKLRKKYKRPEPNTDRLYQPRALHPPNDESSCATTCGDDPSTLIVRDERSEDEDNPSIHYGLIASANRLMKDALMRDALAMKKDVLCFEMEAAGLMNHFPCLVIRGICDYSDSHKNKEWQGYAAMAAAAYAKDLLCRIAPNRVEAEKKIGDILSGLHEFAEEHLDVAKRHHEVAEENRDLTKEQLQAQEDLAKERLSKDKQEEEQKCHQLFRLTTDGSDATYEWYKGRVEERVEGTCLWLLKHKHFQSWLEQESGPLLVTADPGCGKSVLAKYLIDHGLPRSTTICYFFFKDQDQNTVRQALCALLHQLFSQRLSLIEHALRQFRQDGQSLINSTESLWEILRNAVKDPQAGPVIMVLDALDECAESEFADLMRNVESQFRSNQLGYGKLKYLLTSRPYEQIVSRFCCLLDDLQKNRIPGEEESKTISQEVNRVITHRVNHLSEKKRLSPQIKSHLEKRLQETTHRTYLWVYLVFDYLENESFKKTLKGIESAIATLPMSINEAYEQILHKSNAKEHPMVRKVLSIILAASRPLTLSEMNVALNIDNTSQSFHDLDLEDEEDFKLRLRSWCGLFVSIYHGKIYFLHQTAREFLLADLASPTTVPSEPHWHHSITTRQAHAVIAELCVLYLNFFNSDVSLPTDVNREAGHPVDCHAFLDYSAKTWGAHFREADIIDDAALVPSALRICNPDSKSYSAWFRIYWKTTGMNTTEYFTDLMVASYFGHGAVVKLLLQQGAEVDSKDRYYGGTPLWWAARNGHEVVVKLLLDKGADVEAKGRESGQTPLWWATKNGHEVVVKLLLDKGADVEAEGKDRLGRGRTPLWWAARIGHEAVVKLLLDKGADVEAEGKDRLGRGRTPLWWATRIEHEAVVKLLLDKGADVDVEAKDRFGGGTPLSRAAKNGHHTAAAAAASKGGVEVIQVLLSRGEEVKITADVVRAAAGNEDSGEEVMALLLEKRGDEVKITADVVNAAVGNWQSGKGVITLLLEKDLQSHPSNLPSRNVCLLDDRTNDGKRSDPQRRPGPLNVRQLYLELKKERFPLGNLHCVQDQDTTAVDTDSAQPTSLNADKRLIFLTDLNPWGAMALVSTASKNEAAKLQRMIYRHLTFESYIGVRSVASNQFPSYEFAFDLPYFVWRTTPSNTKPDDAKSRGRDEPLRNVMDLSFLSKNGPASACPSPTDYLCEAHTSVLLISAIDTRRNTAYALVDAYFDDGTEAESAEAYFINWDSDSDFDDDDEDSYADDLLHLDPLTRGAFDANKHVQDPWMYFWAALQARMEVVEAEWRIVAKNANDRIKKYIDSCQLPSLTSEQHCAAWIRDTRSLLGKLIETLEALIYEWKRFQPHDSFSKYSVARELSSVHESFQVLEKYVWKLKCLQKNCDEFSKAVALYMAEEANRGFKTQAGVARFGITMAIVMLLFHGPLSIFSGIYSIQAEPIPHFLGPTKFSFITLTIKLTVVVSFFVLLIHFRRKA